MKSFFVIAGLVFWIVLLFICNLNEILDTNKLKEKIKIKRKDKDED